MGQTTDIRFASSTVMSEVSVRFISAETRLGTVRILEIRQQMVEQIPIVNRPRMGVEI